MSMNRGEAARLSKDSQWHATVEDISDLIAATPKELGRGKLQESATRAISFVLQNLHSRGIIDDPFINLKEQD